jgi:hypothetical protein
VPKDTQNGTPQLQAAPKAKADKLYKLYKIVAKEQFEFISEYECEGFAILGGYNLFCFNEN